EINEISREIEEIGQSDFPIYETTTQLLLYQKEKQLLLEELNYIYHHFSKNQELYFSEIAYKFARVEQDISRTLLDGIKQSQFALQEEKEKEDKIRLNQEKEDYQKLQSIFLKLELENQKFNLIIEQFLEQAISQQISPSTSLIQEARLELQVFDELTLEILQRLKNHIDGSVSATFDERSLAVKTNALVAFGALLLGLFLSTLVTRQITSSVNKLTKQAKFIAENIGRENLAPEVLVINTNDELRDLSVAFNRMVENFLASQAERNKIAEEMLSEKELAQWQASHDALTGLVNRREFEHQLSQIWESDNQKVHSLLYMDLDRFKIVNDTCGHHAGDELLRQVTQVLQAQIRNSDTLARLGGDEFAVILYGCPQEHAVALADKILSTVQKFCFIWHNRTFTIGVSIGVVSFTSQENTLTSMLTAADAACYSAKNNGRNQIYVMDNKAQELAQQSQEMNWLAAIHQALDSDRFLLFYQTIKPLQTDSSGSEHYEVLLRMKGDNGQIIPPMAFLPIAERYQLMNQIDRWVIRTLFATQGHHYRKRGRISQENGHSLNSLYAINLSAQTLDDVNFVQFVKEELNRHQIPPQFICFEITETVAIANLLQAKLMITQLRELVFGVTAI
ncbi:MAG: diguanylate cyclase, partial [Xenococcaceae cyanobacterium MO_188.B29]|nr:diguanylate cyclase [Xenococcaceae cyanobacterium MO_188.B29]